MVSWDTLGAHGIALLLIWSAVLLPGLALLPYLRVGIGLAGAPVLGFIYWTISLYLLPFAHGLDIATGFVVVLALWQIARTWPPKWKALAWRRPSWATVILFIGCIPFTTTLLVHYLPFGDASMYMTHSVLIANAGGLPSDYFPFMPDVPLPSVNMAMPAVCGIAIRWGGDAAGVMLAAQHLTFTCLILATYVLLRRWTPRTSAAVLAVFSVCLARASQASICWGGFPNVMSIAVGVLAARLLLQQSRSSSWRLSLATGACVAALPLVHGIGAVSWLYCVGTWVVIATIARARSQVVTWRGLLISGCFAAAFLGVYRSAATLEVQAFDIDLTKEQVQNFPLVWQPGNAWLLALDYVRKDSGSVIVLAGWGACLLLAVRRQWLAALLLTCAWLTLTTLVANSRWYVLPGSFLLYPDRVIYWSAPLSAIGLALAWRSTSLPWRRSVWAGTLAFCVLLMACYFQNNFYQKGVREEFVSRDDWEALQWAKQNLHPRKHFVQTLGNSTGSYLPSIAMVGCNGSQHHHFILRPLHEAIGKRVLTHRFVENVGRKDEANIEGKVLFQNRAVTIVELTKRENEL